MANAAASLWPQDIRVPTRSPLSILKEQAGLLNEVTKGVLQGEVTTVTGADDFVIHRLDIVTPRLDGARYRVLTITHRTALYPVVMEADVFRIARPLPSVARELFSEVWPRPDDWRPVAASQEEFTARLREVLNSPHVRGLIETLILQSNESAPEDETAGRPTLDEGPAS
jgi:hypothetical protein